MTDYGRHECIEAPGGYHCTVCKQTFNRFAQTGQYCPGKGFYGSFASVPKTLKTVGKWKDKGKRPKKGEEPKAYVHMHAYGKSTWANLWDENQVEDISRGGRR